MGGKSEKPLVEKIRFHLEEQIIGLIQDSLTHRPLGLYGMAKTVVGYAASSLGMRIDVDNPGSRLLMGMAFYIVHQLIYFVVARGLVAYDAREMPALVGRKTAELPPEHRREVVHRDEMVLVRRHVGRADAG